MTEFYYLLMSNFEFLTDNVVEEILRERGGYYLSKNKTRDFWIIESPQFIYENKIYQDFQKTLFYTKNKNQKYFAILSSDKIFIDWLALRIGYFEPWQILKLNQKNFTINGLTGKSQKINPLISLDLPPENPF